MHEYNPNLAYNAAPAAPAPAASGAQRAQALQGYQVAAPSTGFPAASAPPPGPDGSMQRLQEILDRFEVTIAQANELVLLEDYDIMIVADDSGSMTGAAAPAHMRTLGTPSKTRWDELKETIASIVDIAVCFQRDGVDINFLNRPTAAKVKGSMDPAFATCFRDPPRGRTPLTETIRRISAENKSRERKLLLFIMTDGEPNSGPRPCIDAIRELTSSGKVKVQVMVCTPEDQEVEWLNGLDVELASVDVTDDYFTEQAEVLKAGLAPRFTRGDWVMKAMLGPICRKFDQWDERTGGGGGGGGGGRIQKQECAECVIS
mmetsp:Transcript_30019/g.45234  ORF Transcript_30019/g.45234 Transcript_30019/m.45234 type:complete len:317 (+) Transcript_30019:51-1001(+)